jgi:3-deoxy-D-manno-octulosonate 8-phosphate phosphatase (KDO 8-P phosphatase)
LADVSVLVLDIDGVLTNGEVILDEGGRESKSLFFRDIDAVFAARRAGLRIVLVTGENTPMVDAIARKLDVLEVHRDRRDKLEALHVLGVPLEHVCYVGDSARDAPALEAAGLGLAPADAAPEALAAADRVLKSAGGRGAVGEALALVLGTRASA